MKAISRYYIRLLATTLVGLKSDISNFCDHTDTDNNNNSADNIYPQQTRIIRNRRHSSDYYNKNRCDSSSTDIPGQGFTRWTGAQASANTKAATCQGVLPVSIDSDNLMSATNGNKSGGEIPTEFMGYSMQEIDQEINR